MTIEDGHFRTDGETIEPCCEGMKNSLDESINDDLFYYDKENSTYNIYGSEHNDHSGIIISDAEYCPFCGAKLEYVDKLDGE